jgi:molecular chaperone GrpE
LKNLFAKYGIEEFDPTGQKYDPNTQESLLKIPIPKGSKKQSDTVAQTSRTGFRIKGRLLRSAHVCIY